MGILEGYDGQEEPEVSKIRLKIMNWVVMVNTRV